MSGDSVELLLDIGNTRIKWRLQNGCVAHSGVVSDIEDLMSQLGNKKLRRVLVSSVRNVELTSDLVSTINAQFGCEVLQAVSELKSCGVTNNYKKPSQLGVDRWLATIAGYKRAAGGCIIIDAGSAVTVDYVDQYGIFQGGVIAPGLEMLKQSLRGGTDRVSFNNSFSTRDNPLGLDTQSAVTSGVMLMLIGFVNEALVSLGRYCNNSPVIYITGGDATSIIPYVDADLCYLDELVLDGLAHYFSQR